MDSWVIIVFWILVGCAVAVYEARRRGLFTRKGEIVDEVRDVNVKELIDRVLKELNCTGTWGEVEKEESVSYQYQGGHFRIRLEENSPYVKLMFLFFYETSTEDIHLVREICNQCNVNTDMVHVVYYVNGEENTIHLHLLAALQLDEANAKKTLESVMLEMFRWHNIFIRWFSEKKKESQQDEQRDYEKSCADASRELFLLREQELLHQDAGPDWRSSADESIRLGKFLSTLFSLNEVNPVKMEIMTAQGRTILTDKNAILGYDMSTPLIVDGKFIGESAMLHLVFMMAERPDMERSVTIHLKSEKQGERSLYYRISAMLIPLSIQPLTPFKSQETLFKSASLLAAYDLDSPKQRLAEFQYQWKEATRKLDNGEEEQLSEEERMISDCITPALGYDLYYGMVRLRQGRFYEALLYLVDAYQVFAPRMRNLNSSQRETYFNLCYHIGFCYCELKLYVEAHYYLEQTLPLHRITYTQEYVNCLVNSKDFRAMPFIDSLLNEIKESMDDDEDGKDLNGAVKDFISFLNRRKAYIYVEKQEYDKAEKMLKKMLDEPENMDFAIDELAYIQKIKGSKEIEI